jgi:predicted ArsR family transcriptional regulator
MKTSRQRLLEFLRSKKSASAGEIARALKMSAANARHHLAILLDEGVVEISKLRLGESRGRPAQVYSLTRQTGLHNLDKLSNALLQELLATVALEERPATLRRVASHLHGREALPANLTHRLVHATRRLDEMNYQARWEAHAQAPRIVLEHCPYAAILPEHPELCQMDGFLLEIMIGQPVSQIIRLERNSLGVTQCVFALQKPT